MELVVAGAIAAGVNAFVFNANRAGRAVERVGRNADNVGALVVKQAWPSVNRTLDKANRVIDYASIAVRAGVLLLSLLAYRTSEDIIEPILQRSFENDMYIYLYYFVRLISWICLVVAGVSAFQTIYELLKYCITAIQGQ